MKFQQNLKVFENGREGKEKRRDETRQEKKREEKGREEKGQESRKGKTFTF